MRVLQGGSERRAKTNMCVSPDSKDLVAEGHRSDGVLAVLGIRRALQRHVRASTGQPPQRHTHRCQFCACRAPRENAQCLAKSSPCAGPSAGTEVARLRKWHVWCLLIIRGLPDVCQGQGARLQEGLREPLDQPSNPPGMVSGVRGGVQRCVARGPRLPGLGGASSESHGSSRFLEQSMLAACGSHAQGEETCQKAGGGESGEERHACVHVGMMRASAKQRSIKLYRLLATR